VNINLHDGQLSKVHKSSFYIIDIFKNIDFPIKHTTGNFFKEAGAFLLEPTGWMYVS